ncbi:hypothetical protein AwDysgo_20100 [Bacteroidales bacterium]|nr:hypothetical protein AwDysgo_20100 [Bacteroidales bacterium]
MARERKPRETRRSYAIVGEGITEFFYFDGFRSSEKELLKKYNISLKPDKPKHPDFSDIIAKAKSLLDKEYDVVFCLIDMDYINSDATRKQFYLQEKLECGKVYPDSIYFVESNPAFEFWFLLHFVFTDRQFRNCNEVIAELKKVGRIENYDKTIEYFSKNNIYQQLRERLDSAMENSQKLSADTKNILCPYSSVFEVFEKLMNPTSSLP